MDRSEMRDEAPKASQAPPLITLAPVHLRKTPLDTVPGLCLVIGPCRAPGLCRVPALCVCVWGGEGQIRCCSGAGDGAAGYHTGGWNRMRPREAPRDPMGAWRGRVHTPVGRTGTCAWTSPRVHKAAGHTGGRRSPTYLRLSDLKSGTGR